ncbi:MAG: cytochrome c biogenesis protein DipZ [Steroidobacteraceae bacterium]|jgi:cytochrome c biogenesis protein CcdA/thiol-disulfide isomerase/thioredoxin
MTLVVLAFLGGVLTILSPCILPVLPFVFARAEQPFLKSGLPLLTGMALTFAGVATLAAVGGAWAVRLNQYGRMAALVLLAAFAATLLSRRLADWLARPFQRLGNRLSQPAATGVSQGRPLNSLLLGVATGLLWAPCAGPILGLVFTGAAISGPNVRTTLLLFAYAMGAAISLALATLAGGRIFKALKQSLGVGEWIRRGLGVTVLLAVVAIAFGWDSGLLTRISYASTSVVEQSLINAITTRTGSSGSATDSSTTMMSKASSSGIHGEGELPSLAGAAAWLNSPALTPESLRGKVVVVDFWTYSCINCLRALPYVEAWYDRYKDHGLVVIGVHTPEFAFEKDLGNVRRAVSDLKITYPVALDSNYAIWQAFNNEYWPAHYFIDAMGRIRGHHFGEGSYGESEQIIRQLLTEAGNQDLPAAGVGELRATGVQAAADEAQIQSPETYIGYERATHFSSPAGIASDQPKTYAEPSTLQLNQWALAGNWTVRDEDAVLNQAPGAITFRFYARDLHLVMGPGADGKPIRFRVRLDGAPPAQSHGVDIDIQGNGVVHEQRLYQLIRQSNEIAEHTFSIEFLDQGVQAYSFTFG